MPLRLNHRLLGEETTNPPVNDTELRIELNFDSDGVDEAVSISTFEWINDEAAKLRSYFDEGLTGGLSAIYSPEHVIEIQDGDANLSYNLQVDLLNATFGRDSVNADSVQALNLDFLKESADGISFERLAAEGKITTADRILLPYILSDIPSYRDAFITVLTFYVVQTQLKDVVERIKSVTVKGASVIDSIAAVLDLLATIVYLITLIGLLIELILKFFSYIIQKVKYLPCMRANRLIEIGCSELGIKYESPVLQAAPLDRLTIIPPLKDLEADLEDPILKGWFSPNQVTGLGYYDGTFGQFLREITKVFRLRLFVDNDTLKLLPFDYVPSGASFQIPDIDTYQPDFRPNGSELVRNLNLAYQTDTADLQTIDNFRGTQVNVAFEPINKGDAKALNLKGGMVDVFGFARGFRKNDLTGPEVLFRFFLSIIGGVFNVLLVVANAVTRGVNAIIRTVNKFIKALSIVFKGIKDAKIATIPRINPPDFSNLIDNRIGMLSLQSEYFTIHKMVLVDVASNPKSNKVSTDNDTVLSARNIFETYWSNFNQQARIRNLDNVQMTLKDVINVRDEAAVKLPDGTLARVLSCSWNAKETGGIANFVLKTFEKWTNNLRKVITE